MTHRPRRLVLLCGLVPTVVAALFSLYRPSFLANLERGVYDVLVRAVVPRPPSGRIVVVDIDERSLSAVGQWPWRRDVVASLIGRLRAGGASVVALDMIFAERDRQDGAAVGSDEALATTLRAGGVVLGYAMTFDPGHQDPPGACGHQSLGLPILEHQTEPGEHPLFKATGRLCSIPLLSQSASASGFLNAALDPDGIVRRIPVLLEFDGGVYPSLALAAVTTATHALPVSLRVANDNSSSLVLASGASVPLDGKGNLLVRFRGKKRTFPYVSAADVMDGRTEPGALKDKIVFVGTTALGTREVVATPLDTLFAGVEVQATVADNLLQGDFTSRPEHGVAFETQAVLVLGLMAALLVLRFGLMWGAIAAGLCAAGVWSGTGVLLSSGGTYLSPLFPTIGLSAALATMTVAGVRVERKRADRAGEETVTSQRLMVQTLLSLTGIRDAETGRHSERTQRYARVLSEHLSTHPAFREYLTLERIELLASLAPLHDIGKVGVPDAVLNKPGALTPEELTEMRRHPTYGLHVIERAEQQAGVRDDVTLALAKDIVYTHHEKWDGTGYPRGLSGTEIPIPGRIMALVDVYDAVRTRQLYRPPMSKEEAVALITKGSGTHFDPAVVKAFVKASLIFHRLSEMGRGGPDEGA